jgi:hypothetical protein
MDELTDERLREPRLAARLRPALLVEPPVHVQRAILAAVLLAARQRPAVLPLPVPARTISPLAYLLLGAVLLAYAGVVSWLNGLVGSTGWLTTLLRQLAVAADVLIGQPLSAEPITLAWMLVQAAPWLLLLPLGWFLWERDRSAAGAH